MTAGTHVLAEYRGCDPAVLADAAAVEAIVVEAARATGATVVGRRSHQRPDDGLDAVVVLEESHVCLRTVPAARYVAADVFTCGRCDALAALPVLRAGLRADRSEHVVIERGRPGQAIRVAAHRPLRRVRLDLRGDRIPPTVRPGVSPGRGLGLFAARDFEAGEVIYELPVHLCSFDTEFTVETDAGTSVLSADDLGVELTMPEFRRRFPADVRAALARHYELEGASDIELREAVTRGRQREVMFSSFDCLINHSARPNVEVDDSVVLEGFDDGCPFFTMTLRALRPIPRGGELFWDYGTTGMLPPEDWLP